MLCIGGGVAVRAMLGDVDRKVAVGVSGEAVLCAGEADGDRVARMRFMRQPRCQVNTCGLVDESLG